jgi:hypothetical protein
MKRERLAELKKLCEEESGFFSDSVVLELLAEVERLRDMICCECCGGNVDDPQIDEYGDGPHCSECIEEFEEDTP